MFCPPLFIRFYLISTSSLVCVFVHICDGSSLLMDIGHLHNPMVYVVNDLINSIIIITEINPFITHNTASGIDIIVLLLRPDH